MRLSEIYNYLNMLSPFGLQENWDNSGLLVGDINQEIDKIYISLDLDMELVDSIECDSLIITHHPLIFKPLKKLVPISYSQKLAIKLIQKNISLISMHTNFDKTHLNRYVMSLISSDFSCEDDFILSAKIDMEFEQFVEHIKKVLNINYDMNVIQCHNKLTSFSLVTGSGMGFLDNIKTDLFLTGDIKYHEAIEAKLRGISLVDITHYESEKFFCECLYNELNEFQKFAIISNLKNPFKRL